MTTIATRAAAAKPDETAGLLRELYTEVRIEFDNRGHREPFNALIAINTPESLLAAAMMLIPEGWLIVHLSELGAAGGCVCKLGNPETGEDTIADAGERTMALALIAAIGSAVADPGE